MVMRQVSKCDLLGHKLEKNNCTVWVLGVIGKNNNFSPISKNIIISQFVFLFILQIFFL